MRYVAHYYRRFIHWFNRGPKSLPKDFEKKLTKRKWWAVAMLLTGGLIIALKIVPLMAFAFVLFFFGHGGLLHSFYDKRDSPMVIVNATWCLIDIIGFTSWL